MSCFRRLYATLPKPPPTSIAARASSTPLQVRRRRLRKQLADPAGEPATSVPLSPLSLSEKARYERLKRLGALLRKENDVSWELTEEEWLAKLNEARTRIRGTRRRKVQDATTGKTVMVEDIVGKRIYLPNMIFRMVRNHTPPGQPYNPWEATFRIPMSLTKLDIRSYLHAVYGVECTYIRTDNYFKPISHPHRVQVRPRQNKTYKRAVVGLVKPFYYPEAIEDMNREERQTREKWLNDNLRIQDGEDNTRLQFYRSWYLKPTWKPFNLVGPRSTILKAVLARRKAREQATDEGAQNILTGDQAVTREGAQT